MTRRPIVALAVAVLIPGLALAAPSVRELRPNPRQVPPEPSYVHRIEPAVVGLRVRAEEEAASSARLGSRRFGSGVIFDARGYAVTVSYILLDAITIDAQLRDGRTVAARLVGVDLEPGLGIVKLEDAGPWPAAALGQSRDVAVGMLTGTVGVDEDNDLVYVTGAVDSIRRFSGFWEYMLDRALLVAPSSPSWGGSAVVNDRGEVIAIASLRLGEPPHVNLAIPIEKFTSVKDELIASGRIASRPPRPWLGLYTVVLPEGLVVSEMSPVGPASQAGFRQGDRILKVNGVAVASQEEVYEQLWSRRAGDLIELAVQRANKVHIIAVPSVDRHRLYPERQL